MIRESPHPSAVDSLTPEERQTLLKIARSTAMRALGLPVPLNPTTNSLSGNCDELRAGRRFGGIFVTLWRGGTLRGCIGTLGPVDDLTRVVPEVTRLALMDARFVHDPVSAAELSDLRIEISLLSEPKPADQPLSLIPGTHGLIVRRGSRSGCFLPKVAADRGWTAEETLRHCCEMKAGLPADAWRDADTEVLLFTAETFTEGDACIHE